MLPEWLRVLYTPEQGNCFLNKNREYDVLNIKQQYTGTALFPSPAFLKESVQVHIL
jgi:hypothetical protein